jgi:hypothetical protein
MKRNDQVIRAWNNGQEAKSGSMKTDGNRLFSYRLCIGKTDCEGNKVLFDWTATGGGYVSQTTSVHVNKAKQLSSASIMRPDTAKIAGLV